ncbi:MAG: hypothetical protein AVDCRST_MAG20-312 [uncultured Acidimicrobiales bacterium]|uniref:Uncharacterized protein n=1 Tax=uncultured Acidimicrobiales bacterium TaxID=310071 RepID=A0A6J4H6I3_9ACTN|nr:MAG: hypothetical protein AVDCRST_MAG20-312 [uncultured Acidimicrobiales bacterium]
MIRLDIATVLLQWATGGLLFLWVTTRRREVGIGYGWLLRATFAVLAALALVTGRALEPVPVREVASLGVVLAATVALAASIVRRRAGVAGERAEEARKAARVAAMTGAPTSPKPPAAPPAPAPPEFPPVLDLVAPVIGAVGLVAAALDAGGGPALAVLRTLTGAAFLGAVTDAMLLGHWYLVQPGMARKPLLELVRWLTLIWPVEVLALLLPTGMLSVLSGSIADGYNGLLGWFWVACALATIVLCAVTRAALKERYYSAVMAATGFLYLAILTAFGTDLVARAVLAA